MWQLQPHSKSRRRALAKLLSPGWTGIGDNMGVVSVTSSGQVTMTNNLYFQYWGPRHMDDPQNRGGGYEKVNNLICSLTVLYCQLPRLCESWNRTNVHSENYRNFNKSMVRCHNSSLCSTEFLLHSTGREKSATSRCSQRA